MTITEDRIATVTPLHRAPRRARVTQDSALHARLIAESNRLLTASSTSTEVGVTAQDILDYLVGAMLNLLPSGEKAPSKRAWVDLIERTADRLGCPPVSVPGVGDLA